MNGVDTLTKMQQRRWGWLWLAYVGFLFIDPLIQPSLRLWIGTALVFVLFLVIFSFYMRANERNKPLRFWMIGATFVLGLVTFPWNQGASTFFVYAAAFLPFNIQSVRRILCIFALECAIILTEGFLFTAHVPHGPFYVGWPNTFIAIFLVLLIGGGNILFAEQRRAECKLRLAQEENVQLAAVAERERIARDLHDVLGHTLSVIVLKAELARRLMQSDSQQNLQHAAQEIADVESTARSALTEVREAIGGYRSQGLAAELALARRTLDAAGVVLTYEAPPSGSPTLTDTEETVLSLSVREAVTNIVRHAEATRCTMRLQVTPDGYYALLVEDDGCHVIQKEGNGLRGMRERVATLNGRFSIRSEQGTRLLIELPISSTSKQAIA